MDHEHGVIDADGHIIESDAEMLQYLPEPYQGREDLLQSSFFPALDGFHRAGGGLPTAKGATSCARL